MHKKLALFCCLLAALGLLLSGCQLALAQEGTMQTAKLAGMYITTQELFEPDIEALLTNEAASTADDEKLYATLVTETYTDETGETHKTQNYVFEDLDGMALYTVEIGSTEEEGYSTSCVGENIADVSMHAGGLEPSVEGTLYLTSENAGIFYCYPVYQQTDGSVYLLPSQPSAFSFSTQYADTQMTETFSESWTEKLTSGEFTATFTVKASFVSVNTPQQVTILQMDAQGNKLQADSYAAGAVPQTITPMDSTEYLLVQKSSMDSAGKLHFERVVAGRDTDFITTYAQVEGGICAPQDTQILWELPGA